MKVIQWLICLNFIFASFVFSPGKYDPYGFGSPSTLLEKKRGSEDDLAISVNPYNCPVWGTCYELPILHFYVEDLSADSLGYELDIEIDDMIYSYQEMDVMFELPFTLSEGTKVTYWLMNSKGSTFSNGEFYYRLTSLNPETGLNQIELLGILWKDSIPTYAYAWNMFPPVEDVDYSWAAQYESPSDLATQNDYALLAGRLIWNGTVDASSCQYGGLESNGAATQCGIEVAREQVIDWQNAYDAEILNAGNAEFIPPKLLKGVIAVESQFWPLWEIEGEYGLGMITEDGVDMLLKWNQSYFYEKCSDLYLHDLCKYGYFGLKDRQLTYLIGYVLQDIGTEKEYQLIAGTLKAATVQTSQLILNYTSFSPNEVADFETLWRITLGIYQAGCGCMGEAIKESWDESDSTLTWSEISSNLTDTCAGAVDYFDKVVQLCR